MRQEQRSRNGEPSTPALPKRTAPAAARKNAKPAPAPAAPPSLTDERFRVFELAYGAGATLVLSASGTLARIFW